MKPKLSQHTQRGMITRGCTTTVRKKNTTTRIREVTLNPEEIYLPVDAIHVMRRDTSPKIVLEIKVALTRRRTTKEDIMLTLQRMRNLPGREPEKKVKILQAMKSMF